MANIRKKYLIKRSFQLKIIRYSLYVAGLILLLVFTMNQFFFWQFITRGKDLGLPPGHAFFEFLKNQQYYMLVLFVFTSMIVALMLVFFGLYISHRIAGPIFRTEKILQALLNEERVHTTNFRKKDFFPEISELLENIVAKYNK